MACAVPLTLAVKAMSVSVVGVQVAFTFPGFIGFLKKSAGSSIIRPSDGKWVPPAMQRSPGTVGFVSEASALGFDTFIREHDL